MMYQSSRLQTKSVCRNRFATGVAAIVVSCLAACNAADETVETVVPTPESVSSDDKSAADDITVDAPLEVAVITDVMTNDQSRDSSAQNDLRQADSHVHGAANLALALDGGTISVELESPLYNLVGFEHAPDTAAQIKAFETAEAALSDPGTLLQFNPEAGCTANPVKAVMLMQDNKPENHDEHHHEHDEHHHEHDEHGHDTGNDHDPSHQSTVLNYSFTCLYPEQVRWMGVGLFDAFDNLAEIDLVYLGPAQQISAGLTPSSERIQLVD
jgi:hypothetical protein